MAESAGIGKLFIGIGVVIVVAGVLLLLADRVPWMGSLFGWVGKLPGDISVKRDNFSVFFSFGTRLLLSVVLSLLFYIVTWIFRR